MARVEVRAHRGCGTARRAATLRRGLVGSVEMVRVPRITAQVTRPTTAQITAAPTHPRLTAAAETVAVVMEEGIDS